MSKEKAIINNVDDCIERFYDKNLDTETGLHLLFPKYKPNSFEKIATQGRYITAKMAACFNSDAGGYVYAFNYKDLNFINENKIRGDTYADYTEKWNLDKIGMSHDPKNRITGISVPFSGLKYNHTIALFPVKRYGGAKALEEAILNSLEEYRSQGEWFISCLGVWQVLLRWHIACFVNGYL